VVCSYQQAVQPPPTILVVEDDPHVREVIRRTVRKGGYVAVAVADGLSALHYLETHRPAALILDWGLPRLHGRDLQAEMEATGINQHVPVIVVTGTSEPLDPTRFFQLLRKPVRVEALLAAVRAAVGD
jgi:CheY-like chemotaxis protein